MLDIKLIRENPEMVKAAMKTRNKPYLNFLFDNISTVIDTNVTDRNIFSIRKERLVTDLWDYITIK